MRSRSPATSAIGATIFAPPAQMFTVVAANDDGVAVGVQPRDADREVGHDPEKCPPVGVHGGQSVEDRPADLVAQPLIVQDEFANRIRELVALPTALEPAGALALPTRGRRTRGLDRVGRGTKLVGRDMRHHRRLAGGKCGMPSGSAQLLAPRPWRGHPPPGTATS